MKLYYSKAFLIVDAIMIVLFFANLTTNTPLWIKVLLLVPILEFTFHEYVHAFTAWLYGVETEYIVCNFSNMCCKFIPLPITDPRRDKIYYRSVFAGALFQSAIHSFVITILILSGIFLHENLPFIFAGMLFIVFIMYDILPERCDFMRTLNYAKSQSLSPLNSNN